MMDVENLTRFCHLFTNSDCLRVLAVNGDDDLLAGEIEQQLHVARSDEYSWCKLIEQFLNRLMSSNIKTVYHKFLSGSLSVVMKRSCN